MIVDTTFLSDLLKEDRRGIAGPARKFFAEHRKEVFRTTIVSVGEIAILFPQSEGAFNWLHRWKVHRFSDGVIRAAADIDRKLKNTGWRMGENDNWIAGFAAFYHEPIVSHDEGFDRTGIRRVVYDRESK